MATTLKKYLWRVFDTVEQSYLTVISEDEPSVSPINNNPINQDATVILKNIYEIVGSDGFVSLVSNDDSILLQSPYNIVQRSSALIKSQKQPIELNGNVAERALSALQLLSGIVISDSRVPSRWIMPSLLSLFNTLPDMQTNDSFDFTIINRGNSRISLIVNNGNPIIGNPFVDGGSSGTFRLRLVNPNLYSIYRL